MPSKATEGLDVSVIDVAECGSAVECCVSKNVNV